MKETATRVRSCLNIFVLFPFTCSFIPLDVNWLFANYKISPQQRKSRSHKIGCECVIRWWDHFLQQSVGSTCTSFHKSVRQCAQRSDWKWFELLDFIAWQNQFECCVVCEYHGTGAQFKIVGWCRCDDWKNQEEPRRVFRSRWSREETQQIFRDKFQADWSVLRCIKTNGNLEWRCRHDDSPSPV